MLALEDDPQNFQDFQVFRFEGLETREREGNQTMCFSCVYFVS